MAHKCPDILCHKKFTTKEFAEAHADEAHPDWREPKMKGWCIDGCFVDFEEPVTYEVAAATAKQILCSIMKGA